MPETKTKSKSSTPASTPGLVERLKTGAQDFYARITGGNPVKEALEKAAGTGAGTNAGNGAGRGDKIATPDKRQAIDRYMDRVHARIKADAEKRAKEKRTSNKRAAPKR